MGALKQIFAAAALGAMGSAALASDGADRTELDIATIFDSHSRAYQHAPVAEGLQPGNVIAVQVEPYQALIEERPFMPGQELDQNFHMYHTAFLQRHAEPAADIINMTAAALSGVQSSVYLIDESPLRPGPVMERLVDHADVISLSVVNGYEGIMAFATGPLYGLQTRQDIEAAQDFWRDRDVLVMLAAGNERRGQPQGGFMPHRAEHFTFHDTLIKVGAADCPAEQEQDGLYQIKNYSSSGATLLACNPFDHGYQYPRYYNTEADTEAGLRAYIEARGLDLDALAAQQETHEYGFHELSVEYCWHSHQHQFVDIMAFIGDVRELVDQHGYRYEDFEDMFVQCVMDELRARIGHQHSEIRFGMDGVDVQGTSYSTPHAAGIMTGMMENFPGLSSYEMMSAAILAAEPVTAIMESADPAVYHDNGAGLAFSRDGGFGLLQADALETELTALVAFRAQNPSLGVTAQNFVSPWLSGAALNEATQDEMIEYQINIDESAFLMRGIFVFDFGDENKGVTPHIEITAPSGATGTIRPSQYLRGSEVVLADYDGFFGNDTQGAWTVRVPAARPLEGLQVHFKALAHGGVVDQYIAERGAVMPPATVRPVSPAL